MTETWFVCLDCGYERRDTGKFMAEGCLVCGGNCIIETRESDGKTEESGQ